MKTTQDRLAHFVHYTGLNDHQFSLKTGLSNGLLANITKKKASFTNDTVEKIMVAFPELNIEWILSGKGEMLKALPINETLFLQDPPTPYTPNKTASVVYLFPDTTVPVFLPKDKHSLQHFSLPWLGSGVYWAFEMKGNSMQPTINHGDFIIAKELEALDWLRNGEIHVLLTSKGMFIKRAYKNPDHTIRLCSDQEGYGNEEMDAKSVHTIFIAVEKCSRALDAPFRK